MSCSSLPEVSAVRGRLPKWEPEPMAVEDGERGARGGVCKFFWEVLGLASGGLRGREVRRFTSFRWGYGFISPVDIVSCGASFVAGWLSRASAPACLGG